MDNQISDLMNVTMSNLKNMVDVNTIVGEPITSPDGVTIIPVSRVSFGFASGGSDFVSKNQKPEADNSFGGGSGASAKLEPVAFLVVKDGCVRTIQLSDSSNSIDRALTMLPELVEKLTTLVKKDDKAPAEGPKAE